MFFFAKPSPDIQAQRDSPQTTHISYRQTDEQSSIHTVHFWIIVV